MNPILNIKTTHFGVLTRSLNLARVLCLGDTSLKISFTIWLMLWTLVYMFSAFSDSIQAQAAVMAVPVLLQMLLVFYIGVRAAFLLMNSQLHLMGIRKELYVNLFMVCVVFSVFVYDPKSHDNLYTAKVIVFNYLSVAMLWMLWVYSFQLVSMLLLTIVVAVCLYLITIVGADVALTILGVFTWLYFAFWLWRSPIQRQFKFESFAGIVDYCVERLKIVNLKRALTRVKNKEHVVLMGEGDGYINRIFLAPFFSLVFTLGYVIGMKNLSELCLWMILMYLGTSKAKMKITQSQMKLWLLSSGSRADQFNTTERLSLKLHFYPFLVASLMLALWIIIHPELMIAGVAALCLTQLFVIAVDYYIGFVSSVSKYSLLVPLLLKIAFMLSMAFARLEAEWYIALAVLIFLLCLFFRENARKKFVMANLTLRAS